MAKLENIQWPQDPLATSILISLALSALEAVVEFVPDEKLPEASEAVDEIITNTIRANQHNSPAIEGGEIARSAFAQIIRR